MNLAGLIGHRIRGAQSRSDLVLKWYYHVQPEVIEVYLKQQSN